MINNTCFQGRLVSDPELRTTQSGVSLLNFTVAWSEKYNEIERKCFLSCTAWRQTAEFISRYFKKGQEIALEGKLLTESWEKDGQKQSKTVLSVEHAHFCGSKVDSSGESKSRIAVSDDTENIIEDDDLPF